MLQGNAEGKEEEQRRIPAAQGGRNFTESVSNVTEAVVKPQMKYNLEMSYILHKDSPLEHKNMETLSLAKLLGYLQEVLRSW